MSDSGSILDSGTRRQFDSGAVRDIVEGKGRCDLLPFRVLSEFCRYLKDTEGAKKEDTFGGEALFRCFDDFVKSQNPIYLHYLMELFIGARYNGNTATAFLELAIHYEQGAKKHAERNWEKGISFHSFIGSAIRHALKWLRGDNDEPHDRAFLWNIVGLIWTFTNRPECNDVFPVSDNNEGVR